MGTKRQCQDAIQSEAIRCGMPYVTNRWLGGMLTNWKTIQQRIRELELLERMRDNGDFERLTKKEALLKMREIDRLEMLFGGIRDMIALPDLLFVVDVRREFNAIHEANLLKIPVIGMVDTNCDPTNIDYVIPANDDAIRAIKLIVGKIADAVLEGKMLRSDKGEEVSIPSSVRKAALMSEEDELSDSDLLGESTLQKIGAMKIVPKGNFIEDIDEELYPIGKDDEEE